MDSGVENTSSAVTALVESGTLKRILAQVDVVFSNSMIEACWRMLKHQWLFLNELNCPNNYFQRIATIRSYADHQQD